MTIHDLVLVVFSRLKFKKHLRAAAYGSEEIALEK